MLRIVTYYKYEICILWRISTGPLFGYVQGLGFEKKRGRVGGRGGDGGSSLYKGFNFLVSQHKKQTQHIKQQYGVCGEDFTDTHRAQKEESQYFIFKNLQEKKKCSLQLVFFLSFLSFFLCLLFFLFCFLKEGATSFCGSISTAWIN